MNTDTTNTSSTTSTIPQEFNNFFLKDVSFVNLMTKRIFNILIVANPYDAFPDFGDASPKNINWAGAPTSDYRKLHKIFFLTK